MGTLNPTQRITDVIECIQQRQYQLPSIQRPFVWEQDQILKLLDSIMCGYPIGAVMVWKPLEKTRCRPFLEVYTSDQKILSALPAPAERQAYMVLDGQQRLQSLFLSFAGRYNDKRVYLRIDRKADETDDSLHYHFEFLTDEEAAAEPACAHIGELARLGVRDITRFVKQRLESSEAQEQAAEITSTFVDMFAMRQVMLFQEVDECLDYNDVLEVFERVNSGGTPLSKSDLLFSTVKLKIPDMEARFLRIVDELNDGGRHDFNTDFVIKAAFVVFGKRAKYDYAKLADDEFLKKLESGFESLEKAVTSLRVWLDGKALIKSGRFLRSKLALIPLIDYLMMNGKVWGPADGDESRGMRQYLYMAFFTRLYSRAPDNILDQLHDILVEARRTSPGVFPIKAIGDLLARREKKDSYQFRDEYLLDLDLVLNIIDSGVLEIPQKRGWSLERDHIFPQHQLRTRQIARDVDDVGNLRLLGKARNISKSDTIPDDNTEFFGWDDAELMDLYKVACKDLTQENFSQFVARRRALVRERVAAFLGLGQAD